MYLARRLSIKIFYYYRLRESLINSLNRIIFFCFLGVLVLNVLVILWNLYLTYNLYNFLSLFYLFFLQIPIFWFEEESSSELPVKELMKNIKSNNCFCKMFRSNLFIARGLLLCYFYTCAI